MKNKSILLAAAMVQIIAMPAFAANTWQIDSKHSGASFRIKHLMVSNVSGTMHGAKGTAEYDGKHVTALKVDAHLDPNTIDTGEPARDKHLRGTDFFDVEKYPTVSFKSKKVVKSGSGYKLIGDLTLHGVTKEVALEMEQPTAIVKDPKGNEHVGTSAHTKFKRSDFGISFDPSGVSISDPVEVTIDVDLVRDKETASSEGAKKEG